MKDTIFNLTDEEVLHHHIHVDNARSLIQAQLGLGAEEDGTLSGYYGGFYLIVGFSHLHPLMVFSPYSFSVLWIDAWPTLRKAIAPFCATNKEKMEVKS